MHWLAALDSAAERFDGGRRSFPLASEADFVRNYAYEPPNEDYEKLFFCRATISRSQRDPGARPHSAGWLIPTCDDASVCKPVFIAHSVLSAIWLLRETLADDVLPDNIWDRLVCAAESLAEDGMEEPPSAQKPFASPSQQASAPPRNKRSGHTYLRRPLHQSALEQPPMRHIQPALSYEQLKDSPLHITTISNNNRRAEQKRSRTLATSRAKKRLALGLVAPGDKAPLPEQAAYTSIVQKDKSVVAWIIKQPVSDDTDFYSSTQTPYLTACTLLEKARVLGNQSSRYHAAQFLQAWRERGSPFRGGGELAGSQSRTGAGAKRLQLLSVRNDADRDFCFAWNINDRTRNRYGKGQIRTEAVAALVELVSPNATKKDKQVFRRRLGQAMRWYSISQELGWGILTLIPHDEIANRWIERTLRVGQLHVWIELLKKECPDICAASKALKNWLGPEGIAGGPINEKKTLSIEAEAPATIYEVEEIQDSKDDETDNSVDDSTREQSHASPKSPTPAPRLRQLTLLELFHPVE
ncbi:uncharacterized protein EKO05_0007601 [Ascochyta rabiei]|uniref:uncharacterized protein n=1 Tax=Didymella rabiei TaxID=5454 RepID=UPI00220C36A1|nr:uncharacterized protein EKO05_0007601 [Ascochyta rabiei]UPX17235.1 hypothetical protein EKO05_0007601 [Ascochyta rabiei]